MQLITVIMSASPENMQDIIDNIKLALEYPFYKLSKFAFIDIVWFVNC